MKEVCSMDVSSSVDANLRDKTEIEWREVEL